MDNKGGSSATISGGSGENIDFLNAPENLMGGIENIEVAFNPEQGAAEAPRVEVAELPVGINAVEKNAESAVVAELASTPVEEVSPAEQDIVEFGEMVGRYTKRNEDDIDGHIANKFNSDMKKYEDDPYNKQKVFFGSGWAYKKGAFGRGVGDGLNGTGEAAA